MGFGGGRLRGIDFFPVLAA